eukprot:TRINITY_DN34653_c0_g1_i1.p1 TRINITY_DN34653_c0_g1~~TRINITY_DN34653_c0_g1_i1.p1  ORF type:complete len:445 (-),score=84.55 TRINITY_DN34653_c0_g1_i1:295-1515(-)
MPLELPLRSEGKDPGVRVGRAVQASELWQQLLPSEADRNTISRAHFEVVCGGMRNGPFLLRNLSSRGTLLNGAMVQTQEVQIGDGDIIGIGLIETEYGARPGLQFRVVLCQDDQQSWQCRSLRTVYLRCGPLQLAAGPSGVLRVGRSMQPPEFWQAAVPEEARRNAVSREHFEVRQGLEGGATLLNLSAAGTLLNGTLVRQQSCIQPGDLLAVPDHRNPHAPPIISFQVAEAGPDAGPDANIPSEDPIKVVDSMAPEKPCRESSAVVRIAVDALPAPFRLRCVASCALAATDLEQLPEALRRVEASFAQAELCMGRSQQPQEFWEALLPNAALREQLLARHLHLAMREGQQGPALVLHALGPCEVNGMAVAEEIAVKHGDLLTMSIDLQRQRQPIIQFRVEMPGMD